MDKIKEQIENIKKDNIDPQMAAKIVEEEKKQRADQCGQEVTAVLRKHNCDFDISMILRQGSIMPNIQIVAK